MASYGFRYAFQMTNSTSLLLDRNRHRKLTKGQLKYQSSFGTHTFGFELPAKPAFNVDVPLSITTGWFKSNEFPASSVRPLGSSAEDAIVVVVCCSSDSSRYSNDQNCAVLPMPLDCLLIRLLNYTITVKQNLDTFWQDEGRSYDMPADATAMAAAAVAAVATVTTAQIGQRRSTVRVESEAQAR